jgi:hypothetical protein
MISLFIKAARSFKNVIQASRNYQIMELKMPSPKGSGNIDEEFALVVARGHGGLSCMQSHVRISDGISVCMLRRAGVWTLRCAND